MLELAKEEVRLSGGLAIAKSLARDHPTFYGIDNLQKSQIDQWIDFITLTIAPQATRIGELARGPAEGIADKRAVSMEVK